MLDLILLKHEGKREMRLQLHPHSYPEAEYSLFGYVRVWRVY